MVACSELVVTLIIMYARVVSEELGGCLSGGFGDDDDEGIWVE